MEGKAPKRVRPLSTGGAIAEILKTLKDEPTILATGFISREGHAARDRDENFYMIGSMGQASSIGLGIALCKPKRRVVVLDGDGAVLMNLGILPMIGTLGLRNLLHIVLDNGAYASTGGQKTCSSTVSLALLAKSSRYRTVRVIETEDALRRALRGLSREPGPAFWHVKIREEDRRPAPRVSPTPEALTQRLQRALAHGP